MAWPRCGMQLIVILFILNLCCVLLDAKDVIVETKYGKIRGTTRSFPEVTGKNRDIHMFLGIPYAKPPVKSLRFEPPQPTNSWQPKTLDATKFSNVCPQRKYYINFLRKTIQNIWPEFSNKNVDEDCLNLNIFVPARSSADEKGFPVLFYIHGGTYLLGTPVRDKTPGYILPGLYDVILVTIHYRLGPLGFLTTGDSALPGNYGMLDQVAALKWVNDNIGDFGGDVNRVTIAGNSAGGSSVGLHILSPLTEGLFQRAILESGVELSPFAILPLEVAIEKTKRVARKLLCDTSNNKRMVECLRSKDISDIVFYYESFPGPVVDNNYLPDTPENLRKLEKAKNISVIMGFTKHDGQHMLSDLKLLYPVNYDYFRKGIERAIQEHIMITDRHQAMRVADALEFQYYPWHRESDPKAFERALIKLSTDYFIIAPTFKVATFHSKLAPTYLFRYNHLSTKMNTTSWIVHSSNVDYGFGAPFANLTSAKFTDEDRNISDFIMKCYMNFVQSGDPSPNSVGGVKWERFNTKHSNFMDITAKPRMAHKFHPSRIAFWNFYFPRLLREGCTSPPWTNATKSGQGTSCSYSLLTIVLSLLSYILILLVQLP